MLEFPFQLCKSFYKRVGCLVLLFSSCCFLDVIPYGILSHALVAFSMQAKNAEVVINCVTRVYDFLLNQHGKVLQNAVLDLFKVCQFYFNFQYHVICIRKFVMKILPFCILLFCLLVFFM